MSGILQAGDFVFARRVPDIFFISRNLEFKFQSKSNKNDRC